MIVGAGRYCRAAVAAGAFVLGTLLCAAPPSPGFTATPKKRSTVYSIASIDVLPQMRSRGEAIITAYVKRARTDRKLMRVWYLREAATPNHFQLIEELPNREVYRDHLAQSYVLEFRTRLHPVLGSPYDERVFTDAGVE